MSRHATALLLGALLGAATLSSSHRPATADAKKAAKSPPVAYEHGRLMVTDLFNDDNEFLRTRAWHWRGPSGDVAAATGGELVKKLGGLDKPVNRSIDVLNYLGASGWCLVAVTREPGPSKEKHVHAIQYAYFLRRP